MANSALVKTNNINVASTTSTKFQIDSANSGPQLKNSSGVMQVRDSGDAAFAKLSVLTPTADENAVTKAYADAMSTGHISIIPLSYSSITQGSWGQHSDPDQFGGNFYNGTNSNGDQINYKVILGVGTWTIRIVYKKEGAGGKFKVLLDTVEKAEIDSYAGSSIANSITDTTGIIGTGALSTLSIQVSGKNGSSVGYYAELALISMWRTA